MAMGNSIRGTHTFLRFPLIVSATSCVKLNGHLHAINYIEMTTSSILTEKMSEEEKKEKLVRLRA